MPGILEQVALGERTGSTRYVVACFGDPGSTPRASSRRGRWSGSPRPRCTPRRWSGRRFSVVTTLGRTRGRALELAQRYGFADACLGVRACEVAVLSLEDDPTPWPGSSTSAARRSTRTGPTRSCWAARAWRRWAAVIADEIGVPVVDGVAAGDRARAVARDPGRSRPVPRGEYAPPPPKPMAGLLAGFEIRPGARLPAVRNAPVTRLEALWP